MGAGSGWWGVGEGVGVGAGDVGEGGHAARRMLQPRAPILARASARSFIACPLWARTCLILTTSPRLRKRASTALFASTILLFDLGFHAPVVVWMARKESARMCSSCPPGSVMSFSPSVRALDGVELAGVVGASGGPYVSGPRGAGDDWAAGF